MPNLANDSHKPLHRLWFQKPGISHDGGEQQGGEHGPSPAEFKQVYGTVADLYHVHRPRYTDSLIGQAIAKSPVLAQEDPKDIHLLELGCGPGTLTLPLAQRGFQVTALDPGEGMLTKAREVCKDHSNVAFRQESFRDFVPEKENLKFDAIVAASSIHWALSDDQNGELIQKLGSLLKPDGALLLFWNFPMEPNSTSTLDKVADAAGETKPFYFCSGSVADHQRRLKQKVLNPIEESKYFSAFEDIKETFEEEVPIPDYINFLNTLSNYVVMDEARRETFFQTATTVMSKEHGETVPIYRESLLNIAFRLET